MVGWLGLACLVMTACGSADTRQVLPLGEVVDSTGEGQAKLDVRVDGAATVVIVLGGVARVVEVAVAAPEMVSTSLDDAPPVAGDAWFRPRPVAAATISLTLSGDGDAHVSVWARGAPAPPARIERSLAWTDPLVVDDPALVGLGRMMSVASDDGHGGRLFDAWMRRFATTAHSQRLGPVRVADALVAAQGPDPSAWDLDAAGFIVTGVHNRLDLAARDGGCGQLRVSMADPDEAIRFHLIFLFRQVPEPDDVAPDGSIHCLGTARRWARLASEDGGDFARRAQDVLNRAIQHDTFLLAESIELSDSQWEWRQWVLTPNDDQASSSLLPRVLENPPLFQTIDPGVVNALGSARDAFLGFVSDNAPALAARALEIPEQFRRPSQRVGESMLPQRLDLAGLATVLAVYPTLGDQLAIVGCPTCHTLDGTDFIQTETTRAFSLFYSRELSARAARLDLQNQGRDVPVPPFGPLQDGF